MNDEKKAADISDLFFNGWRKDMVGSALNAAVSARLDKPYIGNINHHENKGLSISDAVNMSYSPGQIEIFQKYCSLCSLDSKQAELILYLARACRANAEVGGIDINKIHSKLQSGYDWQLTQRGKELVDILAESVSGNITEAEIDMIHACVKGEADNIREYLTGRKNYQPRVLSRASK